ncbi:MAG: hypothetical protein JWO58_2832 [Chitinophagaceae bacterium]|nr:hypothetical protein [Chitinophagaceae bacterium]
MQAEVRRSIRFGEEFEHLFLTPKGKHITILKDAEVNDTLTLIQKTVPLTLRDTEKIAKLLKGDSLKETCENIWNFVYNHIQYKRDEKGIEQVRRPARTWWDRQLGVDCDCYTEFISSILTNLSIPHKLRITKYNGKSFFQHIYPIVPKDGDINKPLIYREDYIVIDCVKDSFDDEQTFSAFKDYDGMRLDYLNGIDDGFRNPQNADVGDLSSLEYDHELNGKFGNWLKKVGSTVKKGIRFLNRFTNPGTIMLRNGFLLAMKTNFLRIATRLRFGYLSDEQAQKMGLNMDAFAKLKKVVEKAEQIYDTAGGKKENLKKAILGGKGNRDKKVPMDGLDGLDDIYADQAEYNIIHHGTINGLDRDEELGVVATASITAATTVLGAVAAALSQVKGLFKKNTPEAQSFDAGSGGAVGSEGEASQARMSADVQSDNSASSKGDQTQDNTANETSEDNAVQNPTSNAGTAVPSKSRSSRIAVSNQQAVVKSKTPDDQKPAPDNNSEGFFSKATSWVKENPGKSALIAGVVVGGGILLKKMLTAKRSPQNLSGVPKKKKKKKKAPSVKSKSRVTTIEI